MAWQGGANFPFLRSSPMIFLVVLAASFFACQALPHRSDHTEQELSWLHKRPPEESYLLPRRNRDLGMLYMGAAERSRLVVHKMMAGGECPSSRQCLACMHARMIPMYQYYLYCDVWCALAAVHGESIHGVRITW